MADVPSLNTPSLSAMTEQLASLRDQGAARFAPVRFRYLEAQAERLGTLTRVSPTPPTRLATALEEFQQAFQAESARVDAQLAEEALSEPVAAMREKGDLKALLRHLRARHRQQ